MPRVKHWTHCLMLHATELRLRHLKVGAECGLSQNRLFREQTQRQSSPWFTLGGLGR